MIRSFDFQPGEVLANKYEILSFLGGGWEGEVYKIRELITRIERAAKVFYPRRNVRNRTAIRYAKKLHKLRTSPILFHYHTVESIIHRDTPVTVFISEYIEGDLLPDYLARFRGHRLPFFQAIHLLHALSSGIESIHRLGEYHGDMHSRNVIVQRLGLTFELKFFDLYNWGRTSKENRDDDLLGIIKIFYDAIGGRKLYSKQPQAVRDICCGLKKSLILAKFRNATELRLYLESADWSA